MLTFLVRPKKYGRVETKNEINPMLETNVGANLNIKLMVLILNL
jgi:hypothetical protein